MYNTDRRSQEFIDGHHYFLDVTEANKRMVSCVAHANIAKTRKIAPLQGSFIAIFLPTVSCPITFVGQNMEKRGL